ncbi:MAG: serine/threonine-protein kinase, partial [Myxococcota bacterium]
MAFKGSNRFRLLGKLGEGGMGVVYDAFDENRGMRVALKALRHLEPWGLYRFKREFRALSELSHPNIINLYELLAEGEEWFLTMELVEGVDFITHVRRKRNVITFGALTPERMSPTRQTLDDLVARDRLSECLRQLANALYTLHAAGVVHRDLKPENVMVTRDDRVVLMDFGVIAEMQRAPDPRAKDVLVIGTPMYMAPEQVGSAAASAAADWYAFGV